MPGPNELIGTILAAVVGVTPAAIAAPGAPIAGCPAPSGTSSSWEQDARDLSKMLAGVDGTEIDGLRQELDSAGFGGTGTGSTTNSGNSSRTGNGGANNGGGSSSSSS